MARLSWILLLWVALAQLGAAAEVSWVKDYATALSKAKSSDRLMMIFLYTDWCPYCKQLNSVTYPDPLVISKSRQVIPLKVNADLKESKALIKKYGLLGFPTILFVDRNEQIQGKIPGYEGPESYAADIDRFVASYKAAPKMKARLAKNPNDSEANVWMAALMAWRSDVQKAEEHLGIGRRGSYRGIWYARALCAIGDIHQVANRVDRAIPLFREAVGTAKDRYDMGYAKISIMYCYSMKNDYGRMIAMAKEIVATPNMPEEFAEPARSILKKSGQAFAPAAPLSPGVRVKVGRG